MTAETTSTTTNQRSRPVRHAHRRVAARHGCMRVNQHCVGEFWSDHVVSRPLTGLLMQLTPCNLQMMLGRCSTGGINRVCLVGRQPANADCVRLLLGMHCCLSLSAGGCQWLFGLVPRQAGSQFGLRVAPHEVFLHRLIQRCSTILLACCLGMCPGGPVPIGQPLHQLLCTVSRLCTKRTDDAF